MILISGLKPIDLSYFYHFGPVVYLLDIMHWVDRLYVEGRRPHGTCIFNHSAYFPVLFICQYHAIDGALNIKVG